MSAKILREASPIIDIEHTYLYNKKTMRKIFAKNGFKVLSVKDAFNIHDLFHWAWLFPLPVGIKKLVLAFLRKTGLGTRKIKMYPGNLVLYAEK